MPIYEYVCEICGQHFDRRQGFDDPDPETCPAGHHKLRRLPNHPAIHFKGNGFYVTDNKSSGKGGAS
jgi:putative FmdB family regulatory protein